MQPMTQNEVRVTHLNNENKDEVNMRPQSYPGLIIINVHLVKSLLFFERKIFFTTSRSVLRNILTKRSLGIIRNISHLINQSCLLAMYYNPIHYCSIAWVSTYSSHLNNIFIVEKKCVRLATTSHSHESSTPLFLYLNLLTVFSINNYRLLCLFMKSYSSTHWYL